MKRLGFAALAACSEIVPDYSSKSSFNFDFSINAIFTHFSSRIEDPAAAALRNAWAFQKTSERCKCTARARYNFIVVR